MLVDLELEHQVLELREVARGEEGLLVVDDRRLHLEVAALFVLAPADLLELLPDDHALRVPERRARRALGDVEEVELAPEPAVVAALRLLEPLEVCVEVGLREEGRAVDPRQLRVVLVAAPVRAGEARQLDRLDRLRVLEVRAAAEVGEVALRVERDVALRRVDELDLVVLALLGEELLRLVGGDLLALPGAALLQLALDLRLDLLERVLADRLRELEVVVEAVLDRRPDRDLRARIEAPDGLGQQVRRGVAQDVERVRVVRVARRQDLDRLPVLERQAQVLDLSVRAHEDGLLGQLRPDRGSRVEPRRAVGKFEFRRVGKNDLHDRAGYAGPGRRPQRGTSGLAGARPRRGLAGRRGRPSGRLITAVSRTGRRTGDVAQEAESQEVGRIVEDISE